MVPNTLQPYVQYEIHNALGDNGFTRLYNFITRHYYWKKLCQHCNKYVGSCSECQKVTLKKPKYVNLHLPILQFLMPFISMDLLGPYCKTEKGNQHALTVIYMLTNYVFMILIRSKSTEEIIKAYLMDVYSIFRGSKYILCERGEFTIK